MALYKLLIDDKNPEFGKLEHASKSKLILEKHLEIWLENSPWAIAQETLLIIGRQTTATVKKQTLYPDLIGLDKDGSLVIIELKKGRAPRDVIAQILEYAAWADNLSESQIIEIANLYLSSVEKSKTLELNELFCDTFESENMPPLNQHLRLIVAAEEIAPSTLNVCEYLRTSQSVDISCVEFSTYQTKSGEIMVSTEIKVGLERIKTTNKAFVSKWAGDKSVRDVIYDTILELTGGNKNKIFTQKDVKIIIQSQYPEFKLSNIGAQIAADCVNHNSRHHHSSNVDLYSKVDKGKYKLFDVNKDKK